MTTTQPAAPQPALIPTWVKITVFGLLCALIGFLLRGWIPGSSDNQVGRNEDGTYQGIARAWGGDLYVRNWPGRAGYFQGTIQYGNPMSIKCGVPGEQVTWNELSTDVWYRLADDTYTTAAYVDLIGTEEPPACENPPGEAPSNEPRDTAYAEIRSLLDDQPIHAQADDSSAAERHLPNYAAITLVCYEYGTETTGYFGASDLWYQIEGGGYINGSNLIDGSPSGPPVHPCT